MVISIKRWKIQQQSLIFINLIIDILPGISIEQCILSAAQSHFNCLVYPFLKLQ